MARDEPESDELRKLIRKYRERAEYYEYEYQVNGIPSQEKAWMRNERMADALQAALDGKDTRDELADLRGLVMELDTSDAGKLASQVEYLKRRVSG